MSAQRASRVCIGPLLVGFILVGYSGSGLAEDGQDPRDDAAMEPSNKGDRSGEARATEPPLPRRDDGVNQQATSDSSATAQAPKIAVEQTALPTHPAETKAVAATPNIAGPPPLTWFGITLYGTIDIGVAYLSHGAPISNSYGPGLPYIVQNFSNRSMMSVAGNGLSQSKIGLSGIEPLGLLDLNAVFKLETGFQPTSGRLTDGPRSLLDNNGVANGDKVTAGDSSRAGQLFQGAAYLGVSSAMLGALSFGRQNSLMADDLLNDDPQLQSQAFSPLGFSGASGGLGDTEDKILDDSLKLRLALGPVRLAALYQFSTRGFAPGGSESADVGVDYAGLSIDLLWGRVHGAIAASSLSVAQSVAAPGTLAATVSDNTAYALMARYATRPLKIYVGYEHFTFANPRDPLPTGTVTIGGYVLSSVNNTAYSIPKVLRYFWVGARYSPTSSLDVTGAYYDFRQNSYNSNGCGDNSVGSCSGRYRVGSLVVDERLSPRFDVYTGVNYSRAADGMAAGFIHADNWTSMTGIRFTF